MNPFANWLRSLRSIVLALAVLPAMSVNAAPPDPAHAEFDTLLRRHVAWNPAGVASVVSYAGFMSDRALLRKVLDAYTSVSRAEYETLSRDERLAFLINAYNAWTIELILTKYPDLKSIRDLGSVVRSPWKRRFFSLLGEERSLDDLEHGMIRASGVFDEPRIHFVVNCASIGCPALRPEAMTAARLESQLEDSTRRFLRDTSRNRFDAAGGRLEVSKIFDWYKSDFEKGFRGIGSREQFFGRYAELLSSDPKGQALLRDGKVRIVYLDYDWSLNARR
jgi:hypothetical protein